jgi:gas vesicle protein
MLRREESRHDFAFIAGVIIGAITGAITTLALTPMSGNETREMIRSKVGDMDEIKGRATSVKDKATERASSVAESAKPMMDKAKAKTTEMVEKSPLPVGEDKADGTVTEMNPSRPVTS